MPTAKSDAFTPADAELAAAFKALAHPARIEILRVLAARGTCLCGEIVDELPLAQSTVSQHLRSLKAAGLIVGEIDGSAVCYCIDPEMLERLTEQAAAFFQSIRPNCC
ncbi:MAG: metalloregulator ArsR/SmtB family transcription factor [Rhodothermales bacterium]